MLTLIIPTFNRPQHLKRALSFYNEKKLKYRIIIADSSNEKISFNNRQTVSLFPQLLISFYTFDPSVSHRQKVASIISYVDTSYVLMGAEDDFFIPESIELCLKFLISNNSYSAAQGSYLGFTFKPQSQNIDFYMMNEVYGMRSIEDEQYENRFKEVSCNYISTWYAIQRTYDFKAIVEDMVYSASDVLFFEYFVNSLLAWRGKIKFLPFLFMVRELSFTSEGAQKKVFADSDKEFGNKIRQYQIGIKNHLAKYFPKDYYEGLEYNAAFLVTKSLKTALLQKRNVIKNILKRIIPKYFLQKILKLKLYYRWNKEKKKFKESWHCLERSYEDLKLIKIYIQNYSLIATHEEEPFFLPIDIKL